jgi:uncharacterized membrane protein YgdD (TMEM256/DUF423 family)
VGKESKPTIFPAVAALLLAAGIAAGALGAHALRDMLPLRNLESFQTGAEYLVYSALFMLGTYSLRQQLPPKSYIRVNRLALIGVSLFSGSIFLLSTLPMHGLIAVRILGPVTPMGGLGLLVACVILAYQYLRQRQL